MNHETLTIKTVNGLDVPTRCRPEHVKLLKKQKVYIHLPTGHLLIHDRDRKKLIDLLLDQAEGFFERAVEVVTRPAAEIARPVGLYGSMRRIIEGVL
jgi:hypothetical protein